MNSRGAALLLCAALLGCSRPEEPTFRAGALSASSDASARRARAAADPRREPIPPGELEAWLSEEPVPPPYDPATAVYHLPPPPSERLAATLSESTPLLMDVTSVLADGHASWVHGLRVDDGSEVSIELPEGYECSAPGIVSAGARYLFLTHQSGERANLYRLYLGAGARDSILPVDSAGRVASSAGPLLAEDLVRRVVE